MISLPIVKLNNEQIKQISSILADLGIVFVAATILPSLFIKFSLYDLILGLAATAPLWYLSIKVLKR